MSKRTVTPEYISWRAMRKRCRNPRYDAYKNYGARGITICDRWESFDNFLADMGPRPAGMSLDRIDNDGNYEPSNCRWATRYEQGRNTRKCHYRLINGELLTTSEAAIRLGVCRKTVTRHYPIHSAVPHGRHDCAVPAAPVCPSGDWDHFVLLKLAAEASQ
jgi:hypothetical protein